MLVTMMMGLMRLSILRGRAEICITSTSVSHADNRSTLSLFLIFLSLLTITWSSIGQTEGRVVKLGTVVECRTSSLRLWPDVCLSPSWRRKTQTGSYLMGGRRVWISRFEIDQPLSQWVEMRKIGGAAYMVHFWDWRGRVELILHILRPSMPSNILSSFSGKSEAYAIYHRYLINLGLPFLT